MAQFLPAFDRTMRFEDPQLAYALVPDNKGDVISGINSLFFPKQFDAIQAIPQAQRGAAVRYFYHITFWQPNFLAGISDQALANSVFDSEVNQGPGTANMMLQRACNVLCPAGKELAVDGAIGPVTLSMVNHLPPADLLDRFIKLRIAAYTHAAALVPDGEACLPGWIKRAEAQ